VPEGVELPGREIVMEDAGGAPERSRAVGLGKRQLDAAELAVAHPVQEHGMSAVVADADRCVPALFGGEGFSGGGDLLGQLERDALAVGVLVRYGFRCHAVSFCLSSVAKCRYHAPP
jgi:hypothetical protein